MTLEQIHRAVKEGWHPPDGTPLMDFIWNAALDAAAEECEKDERFWHDGVPSMTTSPLRERILALKKGGTR